MIFDIKVSGLVTRDLQVEAKDGAEATKIAKHMFCEMLMAEERNVGVE